MKSARQLLYIALPVALALPLSLEAVPAFARQMNMECFSCHAQNIPKLNSFGRQFKLSGFTMSAQTGTQSLISGSNLELSLPSVLNLSFITKARYHKTSGKTSSGEAVGSSRGNLEIFDESALFFGGRVADNVGASIEFGEGLLGGKFIFSKEIAGGYGGIAYFTTDTLGAFSGMELYNTGLYRPVRQFENRKAANAAQKTGVGDGAATGIQVFYGNNHDKNDFFVTIGLYDPAFNGNPGLDTRSDLIPMGRIAYTLPVGGWDITLGGYGMIGEAVMSETAISGSKPSSGDPLINFDQNSYGIDLQAEGSISDMPVMVTINSVLKNDLSTTYDANTTSFTGTGAKNYDNTATSLAAQINPTAKLGLKAAYLTYDDKIADKNDIDVYSAGIDYSYRQNVRLVLEYSYTDHSDSSASDKSYSDIYLMSMIAF